jgi:hypothetical protein
MTKSIKKQIKEKDSLINKALELESKSNTSLKPLINKIKQERNNITSKIGKKN